MSESRSQVMTAVLEVLAGGAWMDGLRVLRQAMRRIPPPVASRHALRLREIGGATGEAPPLDELIESGRRAMTSRAIAAAIKRGRLVTDVGELTRAHWQGEVPFKLRDAEAGWLSVIEVAEEVGITKNVAATWIRNGYVPEPVQNAAGATRITSDQVPAWRAVAEAWPGLGKRWTIDPRSLWSSPAQACPHCGGSIVVSVTKG